MLIYYVYAYLRKDGTPYYIGKGKEKRAYCRYHKVKLPTDKSLIVFLETNLSEIGAYALERRYIRWYGRKSIDPNGLLRNNTEGGEGNSQPRSEEWKQNHSKIMKGRNNITLEGLKRLQNMDKSYMKTEEYRKKVSESKLGKPNLKQRGISKGGTRISTPEGIFPSKSVAAKHYKVSTTTMVNWCRKNPKFVILENCV